MDLPPKIRLFVAIQLPEEVRARLAELQEEDEALTKQHPPGTRITCPSDIRWTPVEQIHLTLKFLGDVESTSLDDLGAALRRACAGTKPLALEAIGVGAFPNLRRPRILWAGMQGDLEALSALQERLRRETEAWGRPEDKPFSPHLTVGRLKEGRTPDLRDWAAKAASMRFGSWQAGKIHLMRSVLSRDGAKHSELAAIELPGWGP